MGDKDQQRQRGGVGWSDVGSFLAVILSIAALLVSVIEANTTNRAAEAEVWPYVEIYGGYSGEGFYYRMQNKGVGPALLKSLVITLDGEPVDSAADMVADVLGEEDAFGYDRIRSTTPSGGVISPREVINLFSVEWDPVARRLEEQLRDRLDAEACYCSVYDRCWIAKKGALEPEPVQSCTRKD
ncbi:MAG: hypothetical protein HRU11_06945 [Parvularculaceae bacterium]|nr:hypothetical protein [Parvularculaceae bacterium]